MLIGDIETDGLLDTITKIHCAVFYDIPADIWTEFTPETVHLIPEFLDTQPKLCMHNGIGFDLQVFKRFLNYQYKGKYRDSLLMSRVFWPDKSKNFYMKDGKQIFCKAGPHSVENWAIQFKMYKPVIDDWKDFTPEKLHRCKEDVKIQTKLYLYIQNYIKILINGDKRIKSFDNVWGMEQRVWEIIEQQCSNGWTLDVEKAYNCVDELTEMLNQIDNKLIPSLPVTFVSPTKTENKTVKAFTGKNEVSSSAYKWVGEKNIDKLEGDFCKVVKKEINLNSASQVKDYLLSLGWKPTKYNFKKDQFGKAVKDENRKIIYTTPKIPKDIEEWEALAKKLKHPTIEMMANRGKVKHRLGSIQGYIEKVSSDGRLRADVITCGCNTARMQHKIIVNVPKASEKKFYGKEMRSLFTASVGKIMMGCDANALEGRVEGHYTYPYDAQYALELVDGDIHTKNMMIFKCSPDRDLAKSIKYALLYGCGVPKLADMLGVTVAKAQILYDNFWSNTYALQKLKEDLTAEWKKYGYILAIDGRPLTVRYEHALMNTLFQSAGAIIMKIALCWFVKRLHEKGLVYWMLGNFHDEFQLECDPSIADQIGRLSVKAMEMAGKILKLNVPITGEYKIAKSWDLTH
jgi:DNA polymerase-1